MFNGLNLNGLQNPLGQPADPNAEIAKLKERNDQLVKQLEVVAKQLEVLTKQVEELKGKKPQP